MLGFTRQDPPAAKEDVLPDQQNQIADELLTKKQELMNQINSYVEAAKQPKAVAGAEVQWSMTVTPDGPSVAVTVQQGVVKCVIAYSEELFEGGTFAHHPRNPTSTATIQLRSVKNLESEVKLKALTATSAAAKTYDIHEYTVQIPKFSMLVHEPYPAATPNGSVRFELSVGQQPFCAWVSEKFGIQPQSNEFTFQCTRTKSPVVIRYNGIDCEVAADHMEIAAEIIQNLCSSLEVNDLGSRADFPRECQEIAQLIEQVEQFNSVRMNLTVNMADSAQMVKALIIKAEDARLQHNMDYFLKTFTQLQQFNGELLGEYHKRTYNHQELVSNLQAVNQYIHRAGNLRYGSSKSRTIAGCKQALKKKSSAEFINSVQNGG